MERAVRDAAKPGPVWLVDLGNNIAAWMGNYKEVHNILKSMLGTELIKSSSPPSPPDHVTVSKPDAVIKRLQEAWNKDPGFFKPRQEMASVNAATLAS
jgi:hypothetical protein